MSISWYSQTYQELLAFPEIPVLYFKGDLLISINIFKIACSANLSKVEICNY